MLWRLRALFFVRALSLSLSRVPASAAQALSLQLRHACHRRAHTNVLRFGDGYAVSGGEEDTAPAGRRLMFRAPPQDVRLNQRTDVNDNASHR